MNGNRKIIGVTVGTTMNPQLLGGKIVVDDELSNTSTNPVQNKVMTAELNKKIETLNIAKNTDIDKLFR
jgi:hypothetical protein